MPISVQVLEMPVIVFSEQNKKLTENRTEMKGAELMSGKRTDYLNITELSGHFLSVPTITTDYNHATITLSSQHKRTLTSLHILKNFTNIAYKFADNLIYKSKLKKIH